MKYDGEHMATGGRVEISRDVYLWAIKESQKDFGEIENKPLKSWIQLKVWVKALPLSAIARTLPAYPLRPLLAGQVILRSTPHNEDYCVPVPGKY